MRLVEAARPPLIGCVATTGCYGRACCLPSVLNGLRFGAVALLRSSRAWTLCSPALSGMECPLPS